MNIHAIVPGSKYVATDELATYVIDCPFQKTAFNILHLGGKKGSVQDWGRTVYPNLMP
jgi:hypothetical protein